ncbi:alpha/beta hydrolase [Thiocystis violacea]|uniref:alpha/beta hydrolase n=1 Tax=Thiocystis violacea TaxID=13725 RepID=UPI0019045F7B|nr:alpha/beta fold hydrolase [Thiocystis violacea]MBK1717366.1 dipeptidyl aminopeptidase [Thiocystis violacea]
MTILILVAGVLAAAGVLTPALLRRAYRAPRIRERGTPADLDLPYRSLRIPTVNGKTLFGWLVSPAEPAEPLPAVVVLHGWGGNAEQMLPFAALLHRAGYATLLLDARNHGQSDADSFSSLPRFAEDLERGLDWLARQPGIDPGRLALLGHSVGAGAVLLLASRRRDLAAAISIAAFAHPECLMRRQLRGQRIPRPLGWLILRAIERTIQARFDDIAPCETIRRVTCPVLLVHGETDATVPPEDASRIHANRRDDSTELLMLPDTGHDSIEAIETHADSLVAFLGKSFSGQSRSHGLAP